MSSTRMLEFVGNFFFLRHLTTLSTALFPSLSHSHNAPLHPPTHPPHMHVLQRPIVSGGVNVLCFLLEVGLDGG